MKPVIYNSSNSASINSGRIQVYYGSEQTDPSTEEWCCVIWKNNKEVARYTNSQLLEISGGESPVDMLVAALALYIGRT